MGQDGKFVRVGLLAGLMLPTEGVAGFPAESWAGGHADWRWI